MSGMSSAMNEIKTRYNDMYINAFLDDDNADEEEEEGKRRREAETRAN
jgi:hypothetical protein